MSVKVKVNTWSKFHIWMARFDCWIHTLFQWSRRKVWHQPTSVAKVTPSVSLNLTMRDCRRALSTRHWTPNGARCLLCEYFKNTYLRVRQLVGLSCLVNLPAFWLTTSIHFGPSVTSLQLMCISHNSPFIVLSCRVFSHSQSCFSLAVKIQETGKWN